MTRRQHVPTITVANQKGGVGKSFIADELAWALERAGVPHAFYDLDQQGGTCHETSAPEERDAAVVNVFDMPGQLSDELHEALMQTDVLVVPVRPNERDVPPTQCLMDIAARRCPDAARVLVVNGWTRATLPQQRSRSTWTRGGPTGGSSPTCRSPRPWRGPERPAKASWSSRAARRSPKPSATSASSYSGR